MDVTERWSTFECGGCQAESFRFIKPKPLAHTEHVVLSSGGLYALSACHFRGFGCFENASVQATAPSGQTDETGFRLVKAGVKILHEQHMCVEDQTSK